MFAFPRPSSIRRGIAALLPMLVVAQAAQAGIIQTNFGTGTDAVPGGPFDPSANILTTNLVSAATTGSFYRQDSGYAVVVSRLYDGELGTLSSQRARRRRKVYGDAQHRHHPVRPGCPL